MIARPGRMPINGDMDRAAVLVCDDKEDRPLLFFAVAGHRPQSQFGMSNLLLNGFFNRR
jgi:hypothetical protein